MMPDFEWHTVSIQRSWVWEHRQSESKGAPTPSLWYICRASVTTKALMIVYGHSLRGTSKVSKFTFERNNKVQRSHSPGWVYVIKMVHQMALSGIIHQASERTCEPRQTEQWQTWISYSPCDFHSFIIIPMHGIRTRANIQLKLLWKKPV